MAGLLASPSADLDDTPPAVPEELRACHQALMRRHERLAEQERLSALDRARLLRDREAFEEEQAAFEGEKHTRGEEFARQRATFESERADLREDVIAGVKRDHAELLSEVAELERRRRAALAMLPGPWPPQEHQHSQWPSHPIISTIPTALKDRLRALGISQAQVAEAAGCSPTNVSHVMSGRAKSAAVIKAAETLVERAEAEMAAPGQPIPAALGPALPEGPGELGVSHPARLRSVYGWPGSPMRKSPRPLAAPECWCRAS